MDRETIIGQANQDQELASIRDQWRSADSVTRNVLVEMIEATIHDGIPFESGELPEEWQSFVAQACAAGIRQAILGEHGNEGDQCQ